MTTRAVNVAAVIVAAGRGQRAGGPRPKQWQDLLGQPVLAHTLEAFERHANVDEIIIVISPEDEALAAPFADSATLVMGGETRSASVLQGLKATNASRVLIHDAARPCVAGSVIDAVLTALDDGADGAAPGLAVTDALWTGEDGQVTGVQPRDGLYRAQTPQGFPLATILAAHEAYDGAPADDVEVARAAGAKVKIVPGEDANLKITLPEDFDRAAAVLKPILKPTEAPMDIRLGNGYDVHRFGPGDHVILCGVKIPYERSLQGHSDADVGMHAVTDAIYGALAEGDIGRHFPPSDMQWKGAASDIFLRHACDLAREKGYRIGNVDCTLVCEFPKIGPHAAAMMEVMAEIMGLAPTQISVKATTSERLGFTGRGEGIASLATVTLIADGR